MFMLIRFIDAIQLALDEAMAKDDSVIVIGEGVPDPKNIFGSTAGLLERYGAARVFDMPLSENGMTGVCIGAALQGLKPVLIHQRIDFSLLGMDQLLNNAAKWHYMFNGLQSVPMVVRVIIGKGWGQGPQHSQALWGLYAQVPGLKICLPTTATEARAMMLKAIDDPNPVLFVEHRWLHHIESEIENQTAYDIDLESAKVVCQGADISLAGWSYSVVELLNVSQALKKIGIEAEVIDLRVGHTLDKNTLMQSINKTQAILIHDLHSEAQAPAYSVAAKLQQWVGHQNCDYHIQVMAQPNHPVPTSWHLAQYAYTEAKEILNKVTEMLQLSESDRLKAESFLSYSPKPDVPNLGFKGPF